MPLLGVINSLLIYLHTIILLFIFAVYWFDFRKLRIVKNWSGIFITYIRHEWIDKDQRFIQRIKRKYLWRPKKYPDVF